MMNDLLKIGMDAFNAAFDQELEGFPTGKPVRSAGRPTKANPNGEDATWWRQNGPAFVQSWITWRQQNPNLHILALDDGTPGIELPVVAEVQAEDEVVDLKGYIDRVFVDADTGQALIVDLKSGRNAPAPLQLAFYRRALSAAYGITADYGAYWMAREGSLSTVHDLTGFTNEVVDYFVATTYMGIKNEVFLPHVTNLCKGCGVKQHCYMFNPSTPYSPIDTHIATKQEA